MVHYSKVVAIDGPSGSGKSSIAKDIAKSFQMLYVDTGAMYRALGLVADRAGIELLPSKKLEDFLLTKKMEYYPRPNVLLSIDGEDYTNQIRDHRVSDLASRISKIPFVRDLLLSFQRELGEQRFCIMEGRDIGTVIFPRAFCKIYMTASDDVRAKRRLLQLEEKGETNHSLEAIKKDIQERDLRDSSREVAPLKPAVDAINLDTSNYNYQQVLQHIETIVKNRATELSIKL